MSDNDFTAFFNQIYNGFCRNLYGCHLFRQCISKCIAAEGNDNSSFFRHNLIPPVIISKSSGCFFLPAFSGFLQGLQILQGKSWQQ